MVLLASGKMYVFDKKIKEMFLTRERGRGLIKIISRSINQRKVENHLILNFQNFYIHIISSSTKKGLREFDKEVFSISRNLTYFAEESSEKAD